jgi:hypothetical protein
MEPDPTGLDAGLNPYSYAGNNPVNNTDPSGLDLVAGLGGVLTQGYYGLTGQSTDWSSVWGATKDGYNNGNIGGSLLQDGLAFGAPLIGKGIGLGVDYLWGASNTATALSFSQITASPFFSSAGKFSGQTISDVASQFRAGSLAASDVPIQTINLGEGSLIVNTRSSLALTQGGIPQSQWMIADMTGNAALEADITQRLVNNGLTTAGTNTLRITGSGGKASTLIGHGTIPPPNF